MAPAIVVIGMTSLMLTMFCMATAAPILSPSVHFQVTTTDDKGGIVRSALHNAARCYRCSVVCVRLLVTYNFTAVSAVLQRQKPIEMPFGVWTRKKPSVM